MLKPLYRTFIELTNGRYTSEILRRFSQSTYSKKFISSYSKLYKINQDEMVGKLCDYQTLHELFTRRLKEGIRQVDENEYSVVSPVDAVLDDFGDIRLDHTFHVKGKEYSILDMLGNEETIKKYLGGHYAVLYLSPSHYHRIHSPVNGKVLKRWTLGRKSFPVNKLGMKYGKEPLSKNYRVISEIRHKSGHLALVKVGAMFVNSIEITNPSSDIKKGEEIAYFSFGSTVVLLFEKDTFTFKENLHVPQEILMGQVLGYLSNK
ncbi:phosphatidylserine decarboxylase [Peribacillus tepidiphilus]|uniref:phosphatidylserine decarboxylase n=1 Tax=Peribacillus tepidiphilus TaxID=2652445 RepID=UPI001291CC11|nr:phosphatidylserine decarboxylase [Peribacillus tepidiphilus]